MVLLRRKVRGEVLADRSQLRFSTPDNKAFHLESSQEDVGKRDQLF